MLSPSTTTIDVASTDNAIAVISNALNSSDIGRPIAKEYSTSAGATRSAICALLPTAISTASVISSRRAADTAE